jgi:hypothetical protein
MEGCIPGTNADWPCAVSVLLRARRNRFESASEAAERIAETHRVSEYMQIKATRKAQKRTKHRYGNRPATVVEQEKNVPFSLFSRLPIFSGVIRCLVIFCSCVLPLSGFINSSFSLFPW